MTRRRAQVLVGSPLAPDGRSVDSAECARNHYCFLFFRLYLRNNLLVHFLCFFSPEHNGGNPKKKKKLKKNGGFYKWRDAILVKSNHIISPPTHPQTRPPASPTAHRHGGKPAGLPPSFAPVAAGARDARFFLTKTFASSPVARWVGWVGAAGAIAAGRGGGGGAPARGATHGARASMSAARTTRRPWRGWRATSCRPASRPARPASASRPHRGASASGRPSVAPSTFQARPTISRCTLLSKKWTRSQ